LPEIECPVARGAARHGANAVFTDGERTVNYAELNRLISTNAGSLSAEGIRRGDKVGIVEQNSLECIVCLFALFRLRAIACLFNTRYSAELLAEQARKIGCEHQVSLSDSAAKRVIPDGELIRLAPDRTALQSTDHHSEMMDLDQPATIMFTSGSSGMPKVVLHSFGSHYYNALGSNTNIPVQPGDRWLWSLPAYHVGGLSILFRSALGGGMIVLPSENESTARMISDYGLTHVSLVTTQLRRLLDSIHKARPSIDKLKAVLVGGSAIPERLIKQAKQAGLPAYTTYGLTEMASQVATTSASEPSRLQVLENRQLKLSPDGEILVKGSTLFVGYVEGARVTLPLDNQGWFHTGDYGHFDVRGGLVVDGRRDNMFISGGENIHPEQIEAALCELTEIEEALVVPVKDEEFDYRPVAFLRCKEMAVAQGSAPALQSIRKRMNLPRYMMPVAVYPWPEEYQQQGIKPGRSSFRKLAEKLVRK